MRDATLLQVNENTSCDNHFVQMFFPKYSDRSPSSTSSVLLQRLPPSFLNPEYYKEKKSNAHQCGNNSDLRDSTPFANSKRTASHRFAYTKKGVCVEREKRKTNKQQRAHRNVKWKEEVSSPLLAQMRLENAQWICTVRCKMQSRMEEQP